MPKLFEWDPGKNRILMKDRGVSFEAIVSRIEEGGILATVQGKGKFGHQIQYIIEINRYVYIVPAVEDKDKIFLKTIIPSRKLTKRYLSGEQP